MVLMVKGGDKEFVADAHIDSFIKKGYVIDGVAPTPKAAEVVEKPKKPRKAKSE